MSALVSKESGTEQDPLEQERVLAQRLAQIRWPEGYTCDCGSKGHYQRRTRPRVFVCRGCGAERSVTAGTLLHRTRLPLSSWFRAAHHYTLRSGIAARLLAQFLEVHVETAWQMLHRIRAALAADRVILEGMAVQKTDRITCRPPRIDPLVQGALCLDEGGRARIVLGSPLLPRESGVLTSDWYDRRRFRDAYEARGGDPDAVECRAPSDASVFLPGCEIVPNERPGCQFVVWMRARLKHAYHQVSQRWLARYTDAYATLWRLWGGEPMSCPREPLLDAVLGRCLRADRARFEALVPALA